MSLNLVPPNLITIIIVIIMDAREDVFSHQSHKVFDYSNQVVIASIKVYIGYVCLVKRQVIIAFPDFKFDLN